MPSLEHLIADWRKTMTAAGKVSPETLDELENHLRENVDALVRSRLSESEAFHRAAAQLGGAPALASEFRKLDPSTWWPVKVVIAIVLVLAAALGILLFAHFDPRRSGLLLAAHVFTVTLGYTSTYLVGALGICFVGQRCFVDLSPARTCSLKRVTFLLGALAAGLTVSGVILGTLWAKAEWGRYWAWDAKEVGGLGISVWLICFLSAHRFRRMTTRGLLGMSIVGNIVVSLGWFGGNLLAASHSYGAARYSWFLLAVVIGNLALFLVGLAPAGWLRLRKG